MAKELTREYLESIGITDVSKDGNHIFRYGKEIKQQDNYTGYKFTHFSINGKYSNFYVHRVVYAWHNRVCPGHLQVDHIDANKCNNDIDNLQILTAAENNRKRDIQTKRKPYKTAEIKCGLNIPRVNILEDILALSLALAAIRDVAPLDKKQESVLKAQITQKKAKLRYYDNHTV